MFDGLASGKYDLKVEAPGFAVGRVPTVEVRRPQVGAADLGTVVLAPEALVKGRVQDPDERPVAGAAIRLVSSNLYRAITEGLDEENREDPDAVTDADGEFAIGRLREGEVVKLRVDHRGFALSVVARAVAGGQPVTVTLEPTRSLVGRVVGASGTAVEHAQVTIYLRDLFKLAGQPVTGRRQAGLSTRTDAAGRFEIEGIDPVPIEVEVRADGWQDATRTLDMTEIQTEPRELEIVLERAASVEGTVVAPDGAPVPGAAIRTWQPESPEGRVVYRPPLARTDGDGHYRVEGLKPGAVSLEARHPAYGRSRGSLDASPGENLLDFHLTGGSSIRGLVVDTGGGAVPGARVVLSSRLPSWTPRVARTNEGGAFQFEGLAPGKYSVTAEKVDVGRTSAPLVVDVNTEPLEDLVVEIQATGTISGEIVGLTLDDLSAVRLRANQLVGVGRIDHQGHYEISNLAAGEWSVVAEILGTGRRASGRTVLDPDHLEATLDLHFGSGYSLRGFATLNGRPWVDARVGVFGPGGTATWGQCDEAGWFEVTGLQAGTYVLQIVDPASGRRHQQKVLLDSDRTLDIEVEDFP